MNPVYPKIKKAASTTHHPELRAKILCLLRGMKDRNVTRTCEPFGISRRTYYRWLHRLIDGRFDPKVLWPRSRRPNRSPRQIAGELKEQILQMRKEFRYGPALTAWHLFRWGFRVSATGVYKVLKRAGVIFGRHRTKRKNPHTKRYELDRPGEGFQLDIKFVPYPLEGQKAYVFSAIDDCIRWRFSYAYTNLGYEPALDFVQRLVRACPFSIASIQTDNDICFTNRFLRKSPDYDVEHPFPALLRTLKILHKLIPPGIKELNGKIERLHKTDMDEFFWKLPEGISLREFQYQLQRWVHQYNQDRPHSSLGMKTPMQRLADFGFQLRTTQRALQAFQVRPKTPMSLQVACKLESEGLDSSYFREKIPPKTRTYKSFKTLAAFLAQPPTRVCHMCGNTTLVGAGRAYI